MLEEDGERFLPWMRGLVTNCEHEVLEHGHTLSPALGLYNECGTCVFLTSDLDPSREAGRDFVVPSPAWPGFLASLLSKIRLLRQHNRPAATHVAGLLGGYDLSQRRRRESRRVRAMLVTPVSDGFPRSLAKAMT
jgi:hypothetical protein